MKGLFLSASLPYQPYFISGVLRKMERFMAISINFAVLKHVCHEFLLIIGAICTNKILKIN
jgi:hypothetical protein